MFVIYYMHGKLVEIVKRETQEEVDECVTQLKREGNKVMRIVTET